MKILITNSNLKMIEKVILNIQTLKIKKGKEEDWQKEKKEWRIYIFNLVPQVELNGW
jgi:hypothetical protein